MNNLDILEKSDNQKTNIPFIQSLSFSLVTQFTRKTYRGTEHPSKRWGHSVIIHNKSMIIFGGRHSQRSLSNIYSLDFNTLTWTKIEQIGISPPSRDSHSAISYNNEMLIFGGSGAGNKLNDLWSFNFSDKRWNKEISFGDIPCPRDGHLSTIIFDKFMMVYGGLNEIEETINTVHLLNLKNKNWTLTKVEGKEMSLRDSQSICKIKNTCYFFGGQTQDEKVNNEMYSANFEINEQEKIYKTIWSKEIPNKNSPLPPYRSSHSSVSYRDEYIIVIGGEGERKVPLNDIWMYNIYTKYYTEVKIENNQVIDASFCHTAILCGDVIAIYGGMQNSEITLDSLAVLSIENIQISQWNKNIKNENNNKSLNMSDNDNKEIPDINNNNKSDSTEGKPLNINKIINTNLKEVGTDTDDLKNQKSFIFDEMKKSHINYLITWTFLKKLSAFHQWPIGCIGNFVHNSLKQYIDAKNVYIDVREYEQQVKPIPKSFNDLVINNNFLENLPRIAKFPKIVTLSIIDDGKGICCSEFNQIMYSFTQNENKEYLYFQIGVSMKTSALRLADSFLLISKTVNELSIGLISKNLQKKIESDLVFTPIVNYRIGICDNIKEDKYIPKSNFPEESLELILEEINFMFKSKNDLFNYFDSFARGTHIILYNLKKIPIFNGISDDNSYELLFFKDNKDNPDICYNTLFEEFSNRESKYIDISLFQYLKFFQLEHSSKNIYLFGNKLKLVNPYYSINLLARNSNEATKLVYIKTNEINDTNAFYIDGEQYKGVLFNEAFIDKISENLVCDVEDIKAKDYFNGILLYRGNDLICRIKQSKFGDLSFFIKKFLKNTKIIFSINGYIELPFRGYDLIFNGKEIKDMAVYGFLTSKIQGLISQISKKQNEHIYQDIKENP